MTVWPCRVQEFSWLCNHGGSTWFRSGRYFFPECDHTGWSPSQGHCHRLHPVQLAFEIVGGISSQTGFAFSLWQVAILKLPPHQAIREGGRCSPLPCGLRKTSYSWWSTRGSLFPTDCDAGCVAAQGSEGSIGNPLSMGYCITSGSTRLWVASMWLPPPVDVGKEWARMAEPSHSSRSRMMNQDLYIPCLFLEKCHYMLLWAWGMRESHNRSPQEYIFCNVFMDIKNIPKTIIFKTRIPAY